MLAALFERQGEIVTRDALMNRCWGSGEGSDETLTQCVSQIRRAMREVGLPSELLVTYPKRGYRLGLSRAQHAPEAAPTSAGSHARLFIAAAALLLLLWLLAFPHSAKHTIYHALGWGPTVESASSH